MSQSKQRSDSPSDAEVELHGFDQATVDRMERILEIIECAVRNITVDKDDEPLREYAQFRSELKTLREQSMTKVGGLPEFAGSSTRRCR